MRPDPGFPLPAVDTHYNGTTLQCMHDDQLTLRVPRDLARQLRQQARARGVPASQVVREALQAYFASATPEDASDTWARVAPMVGSLALDPSDLERDALASQLRAHNWRE
jgi:hypothetical protein